MFKKLVRNKVFKQLVVLGMGLSLCLTGCSTNEGIEAGSKQDKSAVEKAEDPVVIRFGSHAAFESDPNYKDPVTGEYMMSEENREDALEAARRVKEKLNVEIEWVQYAGDVTEALLRSVMSGDPIADVVRLYANSQGIILGQNVLQPIDDYVELLGENAPPKIYGKQYFLEVSGNYTHPSSPLFFNAGYIEQVDALKENGKTVYPTDLYKQGKWTWSTFEDYLEKINTHFANSQAPERPEKRIDAYRTDYTEALIQAIHTNGGSIYGDEGLGIESTQTKEAVEYIQELVDKGVLVCELKEGTSSRPYNAQGEPFNKGESVFTNIEGWRLDGAVSKAAERGQSIGFIPFPRPDDMDIDDPNYRQVRTGGETWGILRGVPEEKVPLAIEAHFMYDEELSKIREERNGKAEKVVDLNVDIFHPDFGQDMQDIYFETTEKTVVNEFSNMTGVYWDFMGIAGDAIYGINGSASYDVAIAAKKNIVEDKIKQMEAILNSTEARDNISPVFTPIEENTVYAFAAGTDPNSIAWNEKFIVQDNMDGDLDAGQIVFDSSMANFEQVGTYAKGVVGTIKDLAGNEGSVSIDVVIYDPENKEVPTLTLKEDYPSVALNEDTAEINWKDQFVEEALDKDGLDLKGQITADLSELDTSTAGTYDVVLTVTDYVGNTQNATLTVTVE